MSDERNDDVQGKEEQSSEQVSSDGQVESSTPKTSETGSPTNYSGTVHKVKVDQKDEEISYEDLVKGYSHGTAASRRMNEANLAKKEAEEIKNKFETSWANINDLATNNPEELFKMIPNFDPAKYYENSQREQQRIESLTPEEKIIEELRLENANLRGEVEEIRKDVDKIGGDSVAKEYNQLWNTLSEKYPKANRRTAAALAQDVRPGTEEAVFKQLQDEFEAEVKKGVQEYLSVKKEDAKKPFQGNVETQTDRKSLEKMSMNERQEYLKNKYGSKYEQETDDEYNTP